MGELKTVKVTALKRIANPKGDIYHGLKASEADFTSFGEAYFSTVLAGDIKGWKKHLVMDLNLVVPVGEIRFVVYNEHDNTFKDIILGTREYARLHVPAGYWMAFRGIGEGLNMLLNIASIEHDPQEVEGKTLEEIKYNW